ncbi:MAG TPA: TonB-dependent receptor plug domain-containing protein, partial [Terriglobales bacterium]|nr:TonB-dependent receptor plug domain-containing protein [Terriglobales bacterium]
MRFIGIIVGVLSLVAVTSAAEIKVKVVDPQSDAVSGAQVILLNSATPLAVEVSSAEGTVVFHAESGSYQVKVLAPGFSAQTVDAPAGKDSLTIKLAVGPVSETVYVSATRTPVPAEAAGADTTGLSGAQIQTMNPVAANDALRFLPGAVISTNGPHGGLSSLFVRGGESRYNKVIVDGVPIDEPGGTFDFAVVPLQEADRLEFVRGAQSTLYGSDAMTSVMQVFTRNGSTERPELSFGADGGNLGTAHGYLSLSGARGRFDYNIFGDQYNTSGQGINDDYSNSSQGGNIGVALNDWAKLRLR